MPADTNLDTIYDRISKMWANEFCVRQPGGSVVWKYQAPPVFVMRTPQWQSGWRIFLDWLARHDWPVSNEEQPFSRDGWANEIHIMSHVLHGTGYGYSLRHAAIEQEGTVLIINWWNGLVRPGAVPGLRTADERLYVDIEAARRGSAKGELL